MPSFLLYNIFIGGDSMEKNIDWANLGFGYMKTDYRYVSNFKDGKWDEGVLTTDENIAEIIDINI